MIDSINSKVYNTNDITFNGGVWVLNLCKSREFKFKEKSIYCILLNSINKIFIHNDQSIMNIIFYNNFYNLDNYWNILNYGCDAKYLKYKNIYYTLKEKINSAKIIHFNGPIKPWKANLDHPYEETVKLWYKYWELIKL